MSLPVFLFDAPIPSDGTQIELTGPEARHAVTVTRLRVGERIMLVDGRGTTAEVLVTAVSGKDRLVGDVEKRTQVPQPTPQAIVVQAVAEVGAFGVGGGFGHPGRGGCDCAVAGVAVRGQVAGGEAREGRG